MKQTILATALLLAGLPVFAQAGSMGGYSKMKIEQAGAIVGNFNGAIEEMSGGVRIVLLSGDEAKGDLPIAADKITFEWAEGGGQPRLIVLTGNVRIKHPEADITAGKAEWNFETGELVFTGNPVMNSPRAQNMQGEKMALNMETGTFSVIGGVKIPEIDLGSMGGGAAGGGGGGLSEGDIADWPGLVNALKQGGGAAGHITGLIDPQNRQMLMDNPTDLVVQNKGMLLKQLNALLARPDFYNAAAWSGTPVDAETAAKLGDAGLDDAGRKAANKAAFKTAFAPYAR
ncbi:MAG: OstA-like protein [Candidatus Hydrogenedentota bacterium]|jgi:hypothetical protein